MAILMMCGVAYSAPVSVDAFVSPDDVTIEHLEDFRTKTINAINNADGSRLISKSITPDKLTDSANPEIRWNDAFNDFVVSGLLPPTTSGTLTSITSAGRAYVQGVQVNKDATSYAYPASKWVWVDLDRSGVYTYTETAIDGAEPALANDSTRLARVSSDATEVVNVLDMRYTTISLDASQAEFKRCGMTISVVTPDAITVSPGFYYNGNDKVLKTTNTTLNIDTAGDWATGGSERATNTMGFVVGNTSGVIKLSTTAPTKHNRGGDTDGTLRYSVINTNYWRVLDWFYMNGTGSGNIDYWGYSGFNDNGAVYNGVQITRDNDITTTSTSWVTMTDMDINFYSGGRPMLVSWNGVMHHTLHGEINVGLYIDGIEKNRGYYSSPASEEEEDLTVYTSYLVQNPTQGNKNIIIKWKTDAATAEQLGETKGPRTLTIQEL